MRLDGSKRRWQSVVGRVRAVRAVGVSWCASGGRARVPALVKALEGVKCCGAAAKPLTHAETVAGVMG